MLKIKISEEDLQIMRKARYNEFHPRVAQKMDVVYLKGLGLKNELVSEITGVCGNTLREYLKQYDEGGVARLREVRFYRPSSELREYSGTIEKYFTEHPPRSIGEAAVKIKELTGIERNETQVRKFMKSLNFKFMKVGSVPAKALTEEKKKEQREFLEKKLEPRIAEAKEGKQVVLFADAAHFVCGSFLCCLWCIVRLFIPTMSGRQRYNVLGAIDAITRDLYVVCNETYINAQCVCDLLLQISERYKDEIVTIVMDNAKYQHCKLVEQFAERLNIELLFLPSYSPNLNIIERLWKWIKKDCLNCRYYETFTLFKESIDKSLQKIINHENKKELDSLLALNFQLYDNATYSRV